MDLDDDPTSPVSADATNGHVSFVVFRVGVVSVSLGAGAGRPLTAIDSNESIALCFSGARLGGWPGLCGARPGRPGRTLAGPGSDLIQYSFAGGIGK